MGDCDWVEVAWDEIEKAETQRRLAKCDVILCEPLYAPHFDRVNGQIISHNYSHPEKAAEILKALLEGRDATCILLVPTPKFQLDKPDVADVLWVFPMPGTDDFKKEVQWLAARYDWAKPLRNVVSGYQLEQFARKNRAFARHLLERYRQRLPLAPSDMAHLGATVELVRELTGSDVALRQNPVAGLGVSVDGVDEVAARCVFGEQPRWCLKTDDGWNTHVWGGSKNNALIGSMRRDGVLFVVAVFDHARLTRRLLDLVVGIAKTIAARNQNVEAAKMSSDEREPDLQKLFEQFRRHLEARGVTKEHIRKTLQRLKRGFELMGKESAGEVGKTDVDRLLGELRKRQYSNKTLLHYVMALSQFYRWGMEMGYWEENPFHKARVGSVEATKKPFRALKDDEVGRLLGACDDEERRLAYLLMLFAGLRPKEVRELRVEDINLETEELRVRASSAKSRREERLPLHPVLIEPLREHIAHLNGRKNLFDLPKRLDKKFSKDIRKAGIEKETAEGRVSLYSLRHTFCSALARAGVMPAVAARLMRHRDVRTTLQTYTHVEMEQTREALCRLDYGEIKKWRRGESNPRPGFRIGWRLHG